MQTIVTEDRRTWPRMPGPPVRRDEHGPAHRDRLGRGDPHDWTAHHRGANTSHGWYDLGTGMPAAKALRELQERTDTVEWYELEWLAPNHPHVAVEISVRSELFNRTGAPVDPNATITLELRLSHDAMATGRDRIGAGEEFPADVWATAERAAAWLPEWETEGVPKPIERETHFQTFDGETLVARVLWIGLTPNQAADLIPWLTALGRGFWQGGEAPADLTTVPRIEPETAREG